MPDIELHGMPFGGRREEQRRRILNTIFEVFAGARYADDLTIVHIQGAAFTVWAQSAPPFLRIVGRKGTLDSLLKDMLRRLEPLKIDIEVLDLADYIPAKK